MEKKKFIFHILTMISILAHRSIELVAKIEISVIIQPLFHTVALKIALEGLDDF
jgi:hypothetical protein